MSDTTPIHHEVVVATDAGRAFELFTDHIGRWWPLADFGVLPDSTVGFEDGRLVEHSGPESTTWAEVTSWDPPRSFSLAWHPGHPIERATVVTVVFTATDDGTLVRLTHEGWENLADPQAAAGEYDHGWPIVLRAFDKAATGSAPQATSSGGERWFALHHRPGPALAAGESLFDTDAFGEHLAFLGRLQQRGLLVAAGPLPDEPGAGMTIVCLGEQDETDIEALATVDDRSVATGFLSVSVRPWQVMLSSR